MVLSSVMQTVPGVTCIINCSAVEVETLEGLQSQTEGENEIGSKE